MWRARMRRLAVLVLASALVTINPVARAATFGWTGNANSPNWNATDVFSTNWTGNTKPTSSAATELVFNTSSSTLTTSQNIIDPFILNRLTFGGSAFTINGFPMQFAASGAVNPQVVQNAAVAQTINDNLT